VLATKDVDVAVFSAITGYVGPEEFVPRGSARFLLRRNRFASNTGEDRFSTRMPLLSHAGKLALMEREEDGHVGMVYAADIRQFKWRDGVHEYASPKAVAVSMPIAVTSEVMGVNPFELSAPDSVDFTFGGAFEHFVKKVYSREQ
jgi:hypothetical protein